MSEQTSASGIRSLNDDELDLVTGGVIDGCIRLPSIITFNPLPPSTPPWFGDTWVQVGKTGSLPR